MPPELSAPSKCFNVTNDAKAFMQHRYLQSRDNGNGFEIYHFYRRNKIVIKCVIQATGNTLVQRFLSRGWQTDHCPHTHVITIYSGSMTSKYQLPRKHLHTSSPVLLKTNRLSVPGYLLHGVHPIWNNQPSLYIRSHPVPIPGKKKRCGIRSVLLYSDIWDMESISIWGQRDTFLDTSRFT